MPPDDRATDRVEETDEEWNAMGFPSQGIERWRNVGFGPHEAALARGDGLTPYSAPPLRHMLERCLSRWDRAGFTPGQALPWHQLFFTPSEADAWRTQGVGVMEATRYRAYGRSPEDVAAAATGGGE